MRGHCRDMELLFLAHGELSQWRRFWVEAHCHRCPQCQERYEQCQRLSRLTASVLRGPERPAWQPASLENRLPGNLARMRWGVVLPILLLLLGIGTAVAWQFSSKRASRPPLMTQSPTCYVPYMNFNNCAQRSSKKPTTVAQPAASVKPTIPTSAPQAEGKDCLKRMDDN